jgi:hypothetical protein
LEAREEVSKQANHTLRNSIELFNRKKSSRKGCIQNRLPKKTKRAVKKQKQSGQKTDREKASTGLEKKLSRFKSLKSLVNQTSDKKEKKTVVENHNTPKIKTNQKLQNGYKMKNSFKDIFKKKYSHQHNLVFDRSSNFTPKKNSHFKNPSVNQRKFSESTKEQNITMEHYRENPSGRRKANTDISTNLDSLLNGATGQNHSSQNESGSQEQVINSTFMHQFHSHKVDMNQTQQYNSNSESFYDDSLVLNNSSLMDRLKKC